MLPQVGYVILLLMQILNFNRKYLAKLFFIIFILSCSIEISAAKLVKPNVVFIMADDLGFSELGSYGQKKIKTKLKTIK